MQCLISAPNFRGSSDHPDSAFQSPCRFGKESNGLCTYTQTVVHPEQISGGIRTPVISSCLWCGLGYKWTWGTHAGGGTSPPPQRDGPGSGRSFFSTLLSVAPAATFHFYGDIPRPSIYSSWNAQERNENLNIVTSYWLKQFPVHCYRW